MRSTPSPASARRSTTTGSRSTPGTSSATARSSTCGSKNRAPSSGEPAGQFQRVLDRFVAGREAVVPERPVALPNRHVREIDGQPLWADALGDVALDLGCPAARVVDERRQFEQPVPRARPAPVDDPDDSASADEDVRERVVHVDDVSARREPGRVALDGAAAEPEEL